MPDTSIDPPAGVKVAWSVRTLRSSPDGTIGGLSVPVNSLKGAIAHARYEIACDPYAFCDFFFLIPGATQWVRHRAHTPSARTPGEETTVNRCAPGSFVADVLYLYEVIWDCDVMPESLCPHRPLLRVYRPLPPPHGTQRVSEKVQGDVYNAAGSPFIFVGSRAQADAILAEAERVARAPKDPEPQLSAHGRNALFAMLATMAQGSRPRSL